MNVPIEETKKEKSEVVGRRRSAANFNYKMILDIEEGDESDDENYFQSLKAVEDIKRQKNEMSSAYKLKMENSEVKVSLKNR